MTLSDSQKDQEPQNALLLAGEPREPSLQPLSAKKPISRSQLRQRLQLYSSSAGNGTASPSPAHMAQSSGPARDASRSTRGQRLLMIVRQGWQPQSDEAWMTTSSLEPVPVAASQQLPAQASAGMAAADAAQMQLDDVPSGTGAKSPAMGGRMQAQRCLTHSPLGRAVGSVQLATAQQLPDIQPGPNQIVLSNGGASGCLQSPPPREQAVRDVSQQVRELKMFTTSDCFQHLPNTYSADPGWKPRCQNDRELAETGSKCFEACGEQEPCSGWNRPLLCRCTPCACHRAGLLSISLPSRLCAKGTSCLLHTSCRQRLAHASQPCISRPQST